MLVSLKRRKTWVDYYINIESPEQLHKVIVETIKMAGYIEFCSREEVNMAREVLDEFPIGIRKEVEIAIAAFEASDGFFS